MVRSDAWHRPRDAALPRGPHEWYESRRLPCHDVEWVASLAISGLFFFEDVVADDPGEIGILFIARFD